MVPVENEDTVTCRLLATKPAAPSASSQPSFLIKESKEGDVSVCGLFKDGRTEPGSTLRFAGHSDNSCVGVELPTSGVIVINGFFNFYIKDCRLI